MPLRAHALTPHSRTLWRRLCQSVPLISDGGAVAGHRGAVLPLSRRLVSTFHSRLRTCGPKETARSKKKTAYRCSITAHLQRHLSSTQRAPPASTARSTKIAHQSRSMTSMSAPTFHWSRAGRRRSRHPTLRRYSVGTSKYAGTHANPMHWIGLNTTHAGGQ